MESVCHRFISSVVWFAAITDMLPAILNQLPTESLAHLKERIVGASAGGQGASSATLPTTEEDDEVPDLVDNFDEPSKKEAPTVETKSTAEVKVAETPAATTAEPVKASETPKAEE